MGCNGRERHIRRNNARNIRLIKHNIESCLPAERFGIPPTPLSELTLKTDDQNRNPNPNSSFDETGWGYCTEDQLQELLLKNLEFIYSEAMSKLLELGYDEEVALSTILRSGHCYGSMDVLSNILHNSLTFLNNGSAGIGNSDKPELVFDDLRQLEEYSLAGMVGLLQQLRPQLSKGDAMWCLLMSDLHVGRASSMEIPVLPGSSASGGVSCDGNAGEDGNDNLNGIAPGNCKFHGGWGFSSGEGCGFSISGSFRSTPFDSAVRDIECPKRFNLPPSLKSMLQRNVTMFAAGFRANGRTTMIRPQMFGRSSSTGIALESEILPEKSEGFKGNTKTHVIRTYGRAMGVSLEPEESEVFKADGRQTALRSFGRPLDVTLEPEDQPEKPQVVRTRPKQLAKRSTPFPSKLSVGVSLPEDKPEKPAAPRAERKKPAAHRSPPPPEVVNAILNSLGDLSLEEKKVESAAADQKNEMINNLINQIKDLEGQVKERKEWAHQKAMQAARKLSQDLTELKMLRMEREETQRMKKGKQTLEDSTMKRLSEMENALRKASGQVDRANAAVRRLETENAEIRAEMEASKLSASESVNTCLEVAKREKKSLKKLLSWEKQKAKLQEDVADEKQKILQLQEHLVLIKETQKETEASWRQEIKAKEFAIARAEEERRSKEATEVSAKRKTETLRGKIELDFQRHKDDIQRLEQELSRLRASVESPQVNSRTNAPGGGGTDFAKTTETNVNMLHQLNRYQDSSDKEGDYDRECMLCLKDEVSVVFLPCAHQVLCASCSQNYGKKGKANCPCCRVPIEQRICVYGASS